jgi:DNA polymerase III subunit epsilon
MRQIVLDTETTGLEVEQGHRLIEVGCVELVNRRATGRVFQRYMNPERDIAEGAQAVHGISRAQLLNEPRFVDVAAELLEFLADAEVIIHNAAFDVAFLDAELARCDGEAIAFASRFRVLDTLALARELHPGQRNSLDALCKRYGVDNSRRELHGALLDAQILADVYLAMTGGQGALALDDASRARRAQDGGAGASASASKFASRVPRVIRADPAELAAHERLLERVARASGGKCLFRAGPP